MIPIVHLLDIDVLILCGGLGTRLRDVVKDKPKCLAPINGKPFIDLLLDDLVLQGFQRIVLATGHLSYQLEQHVKQRNDAEYIISREPEPLGTAGAIKYINLKRTQTSGHSRSDQICRK